MDENRVTYFGETDSRSKRVAFGIKSKDRLKHLYTIGKTGMGKSTMLENMAIQDIRNGEGLAFIDPHGKTADLLLDYIPPERVKDVIYFAPFDTEFPISFNIMEDVGESRRHLVVAGLMSTFEKIWVDAWSARMAYILQNTLAALLEYPGSTLLGINRMLSDKQYRAKIVENVKDSSTRSFWVDEFAKYTERFAAEATPAIQNKVGQFTSNPLVRNIIGQPKSSFDMRKAMDEKKILIVNLSKGLVGENNANLIGSMLITKIYLSAMSRSDSSEAELGKLPNFYLYVDEFQSFANKSFADILSEARKYKLALSIAHQYIEQMEEEVRAAVFGNVGTMITFRVGSFDAEVLEKEFAPIFTAEDIVNLGAYQMYLKLMIDGVASKPFSATGLPPIPRPEASNREKVITESRLKYAETKEKVEAAVKEWYLPEQAVRIHDAGNGPRSSPGDFNRNNRNDEKREGDGRRNNIRNDSVDRRQSNPPSPVLGNILAKAIEHAVRDKPVPNTSSPAVSYKPNYTPEEKKPEQIEQKKWEKFEIKKVEAKIEPKRSEPVPLSALAQDNRRKDKGPTEQNKNALRDALAKAQSERAQNTEREKTAPPAPVAPPTPVSNEEKKENEKPKPKNTKEVPEDVLRKILKGE